MHVCRNLVIVDIGYFQGCNEFARDVQIPVGAPKSMWFWYLLSRIVSHKRLIKSENEEIRLSGEEISRSHSVMEEERSGCDEGSDPLLLDER
jgi:hypothetical protein